MKKEIKVLTALIAMNLFSCASQMVTLKSSKVIIDKSYEDKKPEWASRAEVSWEDDKSIFFKTAYTIRGDQRVNGCYDLAKLQISESIVTEIKSDIRAESNLANEGISENQEVMITKSVSQSSEGLLKGLRTQALLFERYTIGDTERVDCFVLSSIKKADYMIAKALASKDIQSVQRNVAEAIRQKQADFFKKPQTETDNELE